jgi:hypothetical protein
MIALGEFPNLFTGLSALFRKSQGIILITVKVIRTTKDKGVIYSRIGPAIFQVRINSGLNLLT